MTPTLSLTIAKFRHACDRVRRDGKRLALVPTMGALHAGHVALFEEAKRRADEVFVSIFVNPTQFGPTEDLDAYPRDLEGDLEQCRAAGVGHVFAPSVHEMYPSGECTRVRVVGLGDHLCGANRPGHFEGVATVVAKLLAITGDCVAVFGRKDYQQLKVIERMTRDLAFGVEIAAVPTLRAPDGLALSSRNAYLSDAEREQALAIPRALSAAVRRFAAGERRVGDLCRDATHLISAAGLRVDYVSVADPEEMYALAEDGETGDRALFAVAAWAGAARLIDNVVLGEDPAPLPDLES